MDVVKYRPAGVCSKEIEIEIDGGIIRKVKFTGGCNGNLKGVARLTEGMKIGDVIEKLSGIECGYKGTSCPDQFAKALREYSERQEK